VTTAFTLGPYHPALPEPIWYQLQLDGETIRSVQITTGYCARGVETLLTQQPYQDGLKLAERLCGSAAHHHRLAFCLALEQLAGVQAPPRAAALRDLFCEIEVILSHLAWTAHLAYIADLPRAHYLSIELRERLLEALERSTGQRLLWGLPIPGGVASAPELQPLVEALERLKPDLDRLKQQLIGDRHLQRRTRGLAPLTSEQASESGLTGPVAQAPNDTYQRIVRRLDEMQDRVDTIEHLLASIPEGPLAEPFPETLPAGEAEASVEGPQGRETWQVRCDGSERPAAVKITTASQRNLAAVPLTLKGQQLRDALLILTSLDICVACVDK
jgi:Ni,Fe-hydrogenase III large subunit